MLGVIAGDIIGSWYEFHATKEKEEKINEYLSDEFVEILKRFKTFISSIS